MLHSHLPHHSPLLPLAPLLHHSRLLLRPPQHHRCQQRHPHRCHHQRTVRLHAPLPLRLRLHPPPRLLHHHHHSIRLVRHHQLIPYTLLHCPPQHPYCRSQHHRPLAVLL